MFFLEHYSLSEKTAFFLKKHLNIVKFNNIIAAADSVEIRSDVQQLEYH